MVGPDEVIRSAASTIGKNLSAVQSAVEAACRRAGRSPNEVTLVAVVKYARLEWVEALRHLGVNQLGESRPQQLLQRAQLLPKDICWHLVGHLQRNKVQKVLPVAHLIHSVDSLRLLDRIDQVAAQTGLEPRVLLQVNISGEATKHGFAPEMLRAEADRLRSFENVRIVGLMTMAPWSADAEQTRPIFRGLRELRDELAVRAAPLELTELSMGMSRDFEVAVEEGATLIRIGSRLFDGLADTSAPKDVDSAAPPVST